MKETPFSSSPPAEDSSAGKANNPRFTRIDTNESGFGGWVIKK
jgi:hypothetical protein